MAAIVERLLDDPVRRKTVGKNAHKFIAENHTWDKVYEAFGEMGL
jgi:glycosyltransferase involved in cell wall biosynthesis